MPRMVLSVVAVVVAVTCRRVAVVVMVMGMIRTLIRFLDPGQT